MLSLTLLYSDLVDLASNTTMKFIYADRFIIVDTSDHLSN